MILEQAGQPFPRTGRVARQHHFFCCFELGDMVRHRLIDIDVLRALRREVARPLDAEIDDCVAFRLREGGREVDRPLADRAAPFLARQIEGGGGQRAITARLGDHRLFAIGEIILDRLVPGLERPSCSDPG